MSKLPPLRSPTLTSSPLPSPNTSLTSARARRRTGSSVIEPFPSLDSDGTASTTTSTTATGRSPRGGIPQTRLLSLSQSSAVASKPGAAAAGAGRERAAPQQQSQTERTDALWAEMQATLADVELSASRGTHFFGARHSAALDQLRSAQMALAQAWVRGEDAEDAAAGVKGAATEAAADAESDRSPGASLRDGKASQAVGREGLRGEDGDAEAARRRREANDGYFARIQKGVTDVVEKLEGVAVAMGKVERESREIWESESELGSEGL